ncbi:hypothetical protein JGH11_14755 [Dysgonomonas sp. Marseille-P4677]|uniref:hypothetical protein n=1 Tax=Dysgonomonas sp. Marseille-P4677 TaxID=2364790 RepID=UPI0019121BF6|nr:hypothetical protein [Dysgonomonas sp. Marseille-P4677]MBK5722135.1 hypothetical protein [Dysgonomonas sp. Marseille-P4677]
MKDHTIHTKKGGRPKKKLGEKKAYCINTKLGTDREIRFAYCPEEREDQRTSSQRAGQDPI